MSEQDDRIESILLRQQQIKAGQIEAANAAERKRLDDEALRRNVQVAWANRLGLVERQGVLLGNKLGGSGLQVRRSGVTIVSSNLPSLKFEAVGGARPSSLTFQCEWDGRVTISVTGVSRHNEEDLITKQVTELSDDECYGALLTMVERATAGD